MVAGTRLPVAFETAFENRSLPPSSVVAARAFAFQATRDLGRLQALASRLNERPPAPAVAALQLVALSQLTEPSRAPAIIVDQTVAAAKGDIELRGAASFLNATLRRFGRERDTLLALVEQDPVARWNHPAWWIERLQAEQPAHWAAILAIDNQTAPMTLRVNRRRIDVDGYRSLLREAGLGSRRLGPVAVAIDAPVDVDRLPGFRDGLCSVQDSGSQMAAPMLDVQPGQRVLDACAAPGGKTGHLAELVDCRLTAVDVDPVRLARVGQTLERLGAKADLVAADAAALDRWWDGEPFDRILVDAPCSASGIVRRHPDVRWLRRRSDPATFCGQQVQLIEALWPALRPGGKLLFATCSIFRSEGAEVVERLLTSTKNARRLPIKWQWSEQGEAESVALLLPTAEPERDHDGFFYGLLTKLP